MNLLRIVRVELSKYGEWDKDLMEKLSVDTFVRVKYSTVNYQIERSGKAEYTTMSGYAMYVLVSYNCMCINA